VEYDREGRLREALSSRIIINEFDMRELWCGICARKFVANEQCVLGYR
jgi:hypothetical protein